MAVQHSLLRKITDGFIFGERNLAVVGLFLSDNDFKEGGLSGSVDSDNGRLFVFFNPKRSMDKYIVRAEGFT